MKFNRFFAFAFIAFVAAFGFISCSDKDEDTNTKPSNNTTPGKVAILSEVNYSYEEIADEAFGVGPMGIAIRNAAGENGGDTLNEMERLFADMRADFEEDVQTAVDLEGGTNGSGDKDAFEVKVMTIEYNSIGADGNPLRVSGNLSYATINGEPYVKNLLVSCHPTSFNDGMMSQTNFKNLAADGLAILEPHYEGFGSSRNKIQCYLCQKTIGRQCGDMIPAAVEVLAQQGITLPADHYTSIIGYSQGGGNAMATARYIQEEAPASLRELANVRKVCCGAGPYDPMATFQHWLTSDSVSFSSVLPLVIRGMMQGHADVMSGITLSEYFSELYKSIGVIESIETGGMGAMTVDASDALSSIRLGTVGIMQYWMRFSGIMSEECANPDSRIRKALEQCLQAEIVNDWTPRCAVEIYSSRKDNVIPYQANAVATYNKFHDAGVNVELINTSTLDHLLSQVNWQFRINSKKTYK